MAFCLETQVIMPLLKSDLYATLMECVNGDLSLSLPLWYTDRYAVGVVAASAGYPGSVKKGCVIHGLKDLEVCFLFQVFDFTPSVTCLSGLKIMIIIISKEDN